MLYVPQILIVTGATPRDFQCAMNDALAELSQRRVPDADSSSIGWDLTNVRVVSVQEAGSTDSIYLIGTIAYEAPLAIHSAPAAIEEGYRG